MLQDSAPILQRFGPGEVFSSFFFPTGTYAGKQFFFFLLRSFSTATFLAVFVVIRIYNHTDFAATNCDRKPQRNTFLKGSDACEIKLISQA